MAFFVNILLNPQGKTYVGQTVDASHRLSQHNALKENAREHWR